MISTSNPFQTPQEDIVDLTMTLSVSPEMNLISAQRNKKRKVIHGTTHTHKSNSTTNLLPSSKSFPIQTHLKLPPINQPANTNHLQNILPSRAQKNHSTCFTLAHTKDTKNLNNQYEKLVKQKPTTYNP
jgi:hypothetical protein